MNEYRRLGRPLAIRSPDVLREKVDEYFSRGEGKPLTISGLANWIGVNRRTLLNYSKKEAFFPTIAEARSRIESYSEENLFTFKNTKGVIFSLRVNFGWSNLKK